MGRAEMPGFLRRQRVRMGCVSEIDASGCGVCLMEVVEIEAHVKIGASSPERPAWCS
mgnify:CR=1 FL=1